MSEARRTYEVRPRKDKRSVDLIFDALPFRRLYYGEPNAVSNAVDYAKFFSRSRDKSSLITLPDVSTYLRSD
jgi:hypothetical protein